jgi:hypothetical protein
MNDDIARLITTTTRKIRDNYAFWAIEERLTELVAKIQPEPVGLTNEQLFDFYDKWENNNFFDAYKTWAKGQTFAFQPDWGKAPASANWFTIAGIWHTEKDTRLEGFRICRSARPQETPLLAAGQTWKNQHGVFEIIAVNSQQVVRTDSAGGFVITSIKALLDNFEWVR